MRNEITRGVNYRNRVRGTERTTDETSLEKNEVTYMKNSSASGVFIFDHGSNKKPNTPW